MKYPILKTAALLILTGFAPLHAADPLAASLPEDSIVFFNAPSLTKLRDAKDHPLVKAARTGELGKALAPMLDKLSGQVEAAAETILKEETGLTLEELLAKFPGAAAGSVSFSATKLMEDTSMKPDADTMGLVMIADFTGDEALMAKVVTALDKLGEKGEAERKAKAKAEDKEDKDADDKDVDKKASPNWPDDYEETVTEIQGSKVHEWKVSNLEKNEADYMSWSIANGKAALSIGKADLKGVVSRLLKPATTGSFSASPAWKTLPDAAQEADLLMGINLERLLGEVQEGMRVKMEKGELNTGGLPINPLQAWVGAGLDQFRMAFVSTALETEDAVLHLGLTYAEKPALLKIYAAKGPGTPPAFAPADVQELSWGTFDWGGFYDNLTALATAVSPMAAGGIEMGTTELKKKIGVDLRKDILGQMGDDLWSTSHTDPAEAPAKPKAKPKGSGKADDPDAEDEASDSPFSAFSMAKNQSQVLGIGLHDAKAFELSLKSIFNTVAPGQALFDDRKFVGTTIHQIKGLPAEMSVAWLIQNDTLILNIGKPDLLEKILTGMAKPPANPLINEPHVKAAFAKLPEGGVSHGYANAGQLIDAVLGVLKPLLAEQADGEAADIINNLPDKLNLPWYLVTRLYLGAQSTDIRLRLSAKP